MTEKNAIPESIEIRGARVHNLKSVDGGEIVAAGTPEAIRRNPRSVTGRYL